MHKAKILSQPEITVQPVVKTVTPVKGEARVLVVLELPIVLIDASMASALAMNVGEVVSIAIDGAQQELLLAVTKKNSEFGNQKPLAVA